MFSTAPTLLVRLCSIRCCQHGRVFNFWAISRQYLSSDSVKTIQRNEKRSEDLYDEGIGRRQQEARRSLFIQVVSSSQVRAANIQEAISKVSGQKPNQIFHCPEMNAFIAECASIDQANLVLNRGAFHNGQDRVPVRSRLLRLNGETGKGQKLTSTMMERTKNMKIREGELKEKLLKGNSMVEQMEELWVFNSPTELGIRKRFLVSSLIEDCLRGLFPTHQLRPFGSSVNGFGSDSSDLDLQLIFDTHQPPELPVFEFCTKQRQEDQRGFARKTLELLSGLLKTYVPGISQVSVIHSARVPIVKFRHNYLDLQCDIAMQHPPLGCAMAKLLRTLSEMDERVPILICSLRAWSRATKLLYSIPGAWFSSFHILVLGLFYLQKIRLLPPVSEIRAKDSTQFQLHQDSVSAWKEKSSANSQTLDELFVGFFEFFTEFDFGDSVLDLESGSVIRRANFGVFNARAPIDVRNPLEKEHNMFKGVNRDYTARFLHCCQVAGRMMAKAKGNNISLLKLCELERYDGPTLDQMRKQRRKL